MSWISASAESRTSRQPLDMKENALEFDEEEDDVVARFSLSMANSEKAWVSLCSLKIFGLERIELSLSLSLFEKMFRNLEVKVFGEVFGYRENLFI